MAAKVGGTVVLVAGLGVASSELASTGFAQEPSEDASADAPAEPGSQPGSGVASSGVASSDVASSEVPSFEVPWTDLPPAYDADLDALVVSAVGVPDARLRRLSAARLSGRSRAEARGIEALQRFVDDALAEARVAPVVASRIHATVAEHAEVVGVRPLIEGGAVVSLRVPAAVLRETAAVRGAPWAE